jgi:hypothetical protein
MLERVARPGAGPGRMTPARCGPHQTESDIAMVSVGHQCNAERGGAHSEGMGF